MNKRLSSNKIGYYLRNYKYSVLIETQRRDSNMFTNQAAMLWLQWVCNVKYYPIYQLAVNK